MSKSKEPVGWAFWETIGLGPYNGVRVEEPTSIREIVSEAYEIGFAHGHNVPCEECGHAPAPQRANEGWNEPYLKICDELRVYRDATAELQTKLRLMTEARDENGKRIIELRDRVFELEAVLRKIREDEPRERTCIRIDKVMEK